MSERGGAFSARLGALRQWGVATGRSRVRVTRDGLRASEPLSFQEAATVRQALARSVPLFVRISDRLGADPYDLARLAVIVEEITGAGRQQIAPRLAVLDRVFAEVRGYLTDESAPTPAQAEPSAAAPQRSGPAASPAPQDAAPPPAYPAAPLPAPGAATSQGGPYSPVEAVQLGEGPVHARVTDSGPGGDAAPAGASAIRAARADLPGRAAPGRVELLLPEGVMSLADTLANVDAMLTVLWAHRQAVAARQEAEGVAAAAPGSVLRREDPAQGPDQPG